MSRTHGLRSVFLLASDIEISSGDGSKENPYVINWYLDKIYTAKDNSRRKDLMKHRVMKKFDDILIE